MAKEDYYKTLGVESSASGADIKKAYRKLAMKYHPDRNSNNADAEAKFKEVKEAYEVLSDPEKRSRYDQFGHAGVDAASMGGGHAGSAGFGDIFDDIFGDMFGGGRGGRGSAQHGADLRYPLELSLEEAVFGVSRNITYPVSAKCDECKGNGAAKDAKKVSCQTCNGKGQVRMQQGFFSIQQTCSACHGQGSVFTEMCKKCHGQGMQKIQRTVSVKIPAGVDNGDRIRLANEGEAGVLGGKNGDLYVEVHIREHNIFAREGDNLFCKVPISFSTATLGGDVDVPTLDGQVNLKIPHETQTGKQFRLKGKGVKSLRSGRIGDLFCEVEIETPIRLNKEQKDLLQSFQDSLNQDMKKHSPKAKSWFSGVKEFFEQMKS